jgi:hypothetical protein
MDRIHRLASVALAAIGILACSLITPTADLANDVPASGAPGSQPATTVPPTRAPTEAAPAGQAISFPGGTFVIPAGLAGGATAEGIPAVVDDGSMPWWGIAPAHVKLTLQGYVLQGRFHEPQIIVYPAEEFAALNESVAGNLQQLRSLLSDPGAPISMDVLPGVPFFNAGALIAARNAGVEFAGGHGIRTVTEYAQSYAPINNGDLFYHFQGLTDDGATYIVAILPVTAPLLAPDSEQSSIPPSGGVPFPGYEAMDEALLTGYYQSVTDLLNGTSPDQFQPTLTSLDALIRSLEVSP